MGDFVYELDRRGLPKMVLRNGSTKLFRTGPWNGFQFSGTPEICVNGFSARKAEKLATKTFDRHFSKGRVLITKFEMASEDDISKLLYRCSMSKEEDDEVVISEEKNGKEAELCKLSILGKLATIKNFSKGVMKGALIRAWKIKEEKAQFIEVSPNIFQVVFTSPNVMTYANDYGHWPFEDYIFLTTPWSADIHLSSFNKDQAFQSDGVASDPNHATSSANEGGQLGRATSEKLDETADLMTIVPTQPPRKGSLDVKIEVFQISNSKLGAN
ncbi:hypothetical protein Syun_014360 [Stephania yunnanensis]|uniref:DUF4283 domain-containing protein n=1 Tax=Stephania yunnanensis TaxID=152371 RepID=A0AAP0JLB3_9MAGN